MRGGIVMDDFEKELNEGGKTIKYYPPLDPGRPIPVRYEPPGYTPGDLAESWREKARKGKLLTTKKEVLQERLKELEREELENSLKGGK